MFTAKKKIFTITGDDIRIDFDVFDAAFRDFIRHFHTQEAPYDTWLDLGYALANQYGEDGYDYFEVISQKSAKFDPDVTQRTWEEIQKNLAKGEVRETKLLTIFNFAKHDCKRSIKIKDPKTNAFIDPLLELTRVKPVTIGASMNEALEEAKKLPRMKELFSTLLLESTLNIWGGDNGVGKSILAISLAEHLARGRKFLGLKNECKPKTIIYYDFELKLAGFLKRYSNSKTGESYEFSPNFHRFSPNPDYFDSDNNYEDSLFLDIKKM